MDKTGTAKPPRRQPLPCTLDAETRELLTLAAKAAGIEIVEWVGDQANVNMDGGHYGWNPLAKWGRGEALTLAVKLRLGLIPLEGGGWDVEWHDEDGRMHLLASCANSGAWALQEAIVQAAAKRGDARTTGRTRGVSAFDPTQPCALTPEGAKKFGPVTECPRCHNPHHKCDGGGVPESASQSLGEQTSMPGKSRLSALGEE